MYKKLLAITLSAFILTACGGSDSSSTNSGSNNDNSGNNNGDSNNGTDGDGTVDGPVPTGVSGNFGDAGNQGNAIQGVFTLCPANTESFSIFAELSPGNYCVPGCPDEFENDDGDAFGSVLTDRGDRLACLITSATPGSQIQLPSFSAPINGCDGATGGCPTGSFPPVYITDQAGDNLAGTYTCETWLFDEPTQDWGEPLTNPAPFSLTLNADRSANINGTSTTWTFAGGVLTLEGTRTFNNVAVGNGSFTEYFSNTYITRCIQ